MPAINSVTTRTRWRPRRTSTRRARRASVRRHARLVDYRDARRRERAHLAGLRNGCRSRQRRGAGGAEADAGHGAGHRNAAGARLRDHARRDRAARQPQRDSVLHLERHELLPAGGRDARDAARQRRRSSGCTRATCSSSKRCSAPRADCRPTPTGRTATSCAWRRSHRSGPIRSPRRRCSRSAGTTRTPCRFRSVCMNSRAARVPALARGNVALADHGQTFVSAAAGDDLIPQEAGERPYRPVLKKAGWPRWWHSTRLPRRHLRRRAQPCRPADGASGDRPARQRRNLAAAARSAEQRSLRPGVRRRDRDRRPWRGTSALALR